MIADFKFYVNLKEIHKLSGDRNMCLEYGDATATKHGDINVCMYEPAKPGVSVTGEWRYLGTFHGNGEFTTADGRACTFKRGVDGLMVNEIQPEKNAVLAVASTSRCACSTPRVVGINPIAAFASCGLPGTRRKEVNHD